MLELVNESQFCVRFGAVQPVPPGSGSAARVGPVNMNELLGRISNWVGDCQWPVEESSFAVVKSDA